MKKNVQFIEAMSELGGCKKGSNLGLDALRAVAAERKDAFFAKQKSIQIDENYNAIFDPVLSPYCRHGESILHFCQEVMQTVRSTIHAGKFPFLFSGDHSSAIGIAAGALAANPEKPLGVIWVDAHLDVHSPFTTYSGNLHGMPIAAMLADDNKKYMFEERNVDPTSTAIWEKMKHLSGHGASLAYKNLVYIGARDYENSEIRLVEDHRILSIDVASLREKGIEAYSAAIIDHLKGCQIYLSFDVDSIDSSLVFGTGTPVKDGLYPDEVKSLLLSIVAKAKQQLVCFETTEINPIIDHNNQTAQIAFDIVKAVWEELSA